MRLVLQANFCLKPNLNSKILLECSHLSCFFSSKLGRFKPIFMCTHMKEWTWVPIFKVQFFNGNTLLKPPSYDPNFKGSNVKCGIIKFKNKIFGKINISSSTLLIQSYLNVRATCVTIMGLWSGLVWSGILWSIGWTGRYFATKSDKCCNNSK